MQFCAEHAAEEVGAERRNAGKQTCLIGTVTGAQLRREELGDVRAVEMVAVCIGIGTVCELCERSKLSGKVCQTVVMEVSNRRARMESVQSWQ